MRATSAGEATGAREASCAVATTDQQSIAAGTNIAVSWTPEPIRDAPQRRPVMQENIARLEHLAELLPAPALDFFVCTICPQLARPSTARPRCRRPDKYRACAPIHRNVRSCPLRDVLGRRVLNIL